MPTGGELTEQSRMNLSEWLDERMVGTIRNHTLEGYRQDINNHVNPYLGQKQLSKITPSDLNDLYTFLLERGRIAKGQSNHRGLSPTTVHGIHTILHHALKTAEAEGLLPANPAGQVMPPKVSNKSKRILNNKQLDKLMVAIKKDKLWHDFFYTELTTGLRRGELCGLKWEDFDSNAGTLKICRTI